MTRKHLIAYLSAKNYFLSNYEIKRAVDIFFDTIKNSLAKGERVEIRNFGIFDTKHVIGTTKRNPSTGESVQTKDHKAVKFKASRNMVERLTENENTRDTSLGGSLNE